MPEICLFVCLLVAFFLGGGEGGLYSDFMVWLFKSLLLFVLSYLRFRY